MSRGRLVVHAHFYQPFRVDPFTGRVPDGRARPRRSATGTSGSPRSATARSRSAGRPPTSRGTSARRSPATSPRAAPEVLAGFAAAGPRGRRAPGSPRRSTTRSCRSRRAHDRRTEILWGLRDFEVRFGRRPTAMWLPETAVDLATLRRAGGGRRRGDDPRAVAGGRREPRHPAAVPRRRRAAAGTSRSCSTTATCRARCRSSRPRRPTPTASRASGSCRAWRVVGCGPAARAHDGVTWTRW